MSVLQRRLRRSFVTGVALAALWAGVAAAQSRPTHVQLPAHCLWIARWSNWPSRAVRTSCSPRKRSRVCARPASTATSTPRPRCDGSSKARRLMVTQDSAGALIVRRRRPNEAPESISSPTDEPVVMEDVVITGIANSLAQALDQKRKATNVIDVVRGRGHRQVPRPEHRRGAAARAGRIDRPRSRRRRLCPRPGPGPVVRHRHLERPHGGGERERPRWRHYRPPIPLSTPLPRSWSRPSR
jgi:hypothetical protein